MKYNQKIEYFLSRIKNKQHFSFVKFNHGWWDKIVTYGVNENIEIIDSTSSFEAAKIYCSVKQKGGWVATEDVIQECFLSLKNAHVFGDNFFVGAWHSGRADDLKKQSLLNKKIRNENILYKKYISNEISICHGNIWKKMVIDKKFLRFIDLIRNKHVILVGPNIDTASHSAYVNNKHDRRFCLENLGKLLNLPNYYFIDIDPKKACTEYVDIMNKVNKLCNSISEEKVILFKAGPVGSAIIFKLHNKVDNAFMIDIGNALDVVSPHIRRPWQQGYRKIFKWYIKKIENL